MQSSKGPLAGFSLRMDPDKVRLIDVVHAIDGVALHEQCAMGYEMCSCDNPCAMHESWKSVRAAIKNYLQTTIADAANDRLRGVTSSIV